MPGTPAFSLLAAPLLLLAACGSEVSGPANGSAPATESRDAAPRALRLKAADGVVVHAAHYPAERAKAVILLFHQANGSAAEYAGIAPRLAAAGFESLAIDQRSGGELFGPNRSVAGQRRSADFLAAEPDVEAALTWAQRRGRPVIIWGSSYSAALVFRLAARHPDAIAALIAFSPGEYLAAPNAVRDAARQVQIPIFVAAASDPQEQSAARAILVDAPSPFETAYLPTTAGIHGSSTLNTQRNPNGAEAAWAAVTEFLARLPLPPPPSTS